MVEEMKTVREDMVNLVQLLKEKQEKSLYLGEELKKLPKNLNRSH